MIKFSLPLLFSLVLLTVNVYPSIAQEPVAVPINDVPPPQPVVINAEPAAAPQIDRSGNHPNPPPVPIQPQPAAVQPAVDQQPPEAQPIQPIDQQQQPPAQEPPQPQPIVQQEQPQPIVHQEQPQPIVHQEQPQGVVQPDGGYAVESNVVHPVQVEDANKQYPLPEMEIPDDEYRKLHDHVHLFDEHHEHHHHDAQGHEIDHDHDEHEHIQGGYEDDEDGIVDEWSEHMDDFIPDMLVTFRLPARSDEYFYQEVGPEATMLRGGYFVAGDNQTGPIQFSIMDPKGEVAMNRRRTEGLFHFVTKLQGTYAFVISNNNWVGEKFVTFVIGAGNETTLNIEHVNSANENVMAVARMLRDIHSESQYLWARQKSQMSTVQSTHSRTFWLTLFELVTICIMTSVQIYLLKGLVSNKRLF